MSQEERTEVHRYPLRTSTRRWQRTLDRLVYVFVAVELLRFGWALTRGEVTVGPLIFLAVVAASRVFVRLAERKGSAALLLSGSGVALGAQCASWDEIERIAPTRVVGKWGRRHEAFVLAEPKPISRALVPSGRYDHIPLGYWWPDWRASPIRDDIERWAPRLLPSTDFRTDHRG